MLRLTLAVTLLLSPSITDVPLERQVLAAHDGWADGTTGGAAADAAHVFTVRTRDELAAAVAGDTPKVVRVQGGIDGNAGFSCADYADPAYDLATFLEVYDPAVWGRSTKPAGPLEEARVRSAKRQGARVNVKVGANTTIVGVGGSKLSGVNLILDKVDNVILRHLRLEDAYDCFPAWDPTDGATGNWNSLYDLVSLTGATHVWVDHSDFSDGNDTDAAQPVRFGRPYQQHDGALDITKASDLVTVSWNRFFDHDKTMLIGSTNTVGADEGHLRVTLHHNRFAQVGQRTPRVRFGQVDVYDNLFTATDEGTYSYSWGVGVYAQVYAENNFVLRSADVPLDKVLYDWRGTAPGGITEVGSATRVGTGPVTPVSFVAAYNATHTPALGPADWVPVLRAAAPDPATALQNLVGDGAGAR